MCEGGSESPTARVQSSGLPGERKSARMHRILFYRAPSALGSAALAVLRALGRAGVNHLDQALSGKSSELAERLGITPVSEMGVLLLVFSLR